MSKEISVLFVCMGNKVSSQRKAMFYEGLRLAYVEMVTPLDTPSERHKKTRH